MKYAKGFPRGNIGASRWSIDEDIVTGQGIFAIPPDRVSAVTVSVHIPEGKGHARFTIETTHNSTTKVGPDGSGGYWDSAIDTITEFTEDTELTFVNTITGARVACLTAESVINVCITG